MQRANIFFLVLSCLNANFAATTVLEETQSFTPDFVVTQARTTNFPCFLNATRSAISSAAEAFSSLIRAPTKSKFCEAAAQVLQSEAKFVQNVIAATRRALGVTSTKVLPPNSKITSVTRPGSVEYVIIAPLNNGTTKAGLLDTNTTPFATFWSSIASSFALTLFTEFGDRTFFIAAILSLRHPKLLVLVGTCMALIIQTVFSTMVGQLLHMLPASAMTSSVLSFPFDDYAAALLLFVFGIFHLRAAWCPADEDSSSTRDDLPRSDSSDCYVRCHDGSDSTPTKTISIDQFRLDDKRLVPQFDEEARSEGTLSLLNEASQFKGTPSTIDEARSDHQMNNSIPFIASPSPPDSGVQLLTIEQQQQQHTAQQTGKPVMTTAATLYDAKKRDCTHFHTKNHEYREAAKATSALEKGRIEQPQALEVLRETFWVIFVAELGDKSMISTVALAAAQNPYGVFVGSSAAHCIVTLIAVIAGSLLEGYISERIANIIGAILFLSFGVMASLEGLARQGIRLWWFLGEKVSALFVAYFLTNTIATTASSPTPSLFDGVYSMLSV